MLLVLSTISNPFNLRYTSELRHPTSFYEKANERIWGDRLFSGYILSINCVDIPYAYWNFCDFSESSLCYKLLYIVSWAYEHFSYIFYHSLAQYEHNIQWRDMLALNGRCNIAIACAYTVENSRLWCCQILVVKLLLCSCHEPFIRWIPTRKGSRLGSNDFQRIKELGVCLRNHNIEHSTSR